MGSLLFLGVDSLSTSRYYSRMKKISAYNAILDVAEELVQKLGFNAFSYADIAQKIGIKNASIHYHFPSKVDLGKALMIRHTENTQLFLEKLTKEHTNCKEIMVLYLKTIFATTYETDRKMCLGGMLATEVLTLDPALQKEVTAFFALHQQWLKKILTQGKKQADFHFTEDSAKIAKQILTLIEGSLSLARLHADEEWLKIAMKQVFKLID